MVPAAGFISTEEGNRERAANFKDRRIVKGFSDEVKWVIWEFYEADEVVQGNTVFMSAASAIHSEDGFLSCVWKTNQNQVHLEIQEERQLMCLCVRVSIQGLPRVVGTENS